MNYFSLFYNSLLIRYLILFPRFVEFGLHGWVLVGQLSYGQIFGVLIGQSQVVFRSQQAFLYLEQLGYGVIYLLDGIVEFL